MQLESQYEFAPLGTDSSDGAARFDESIRLSRFFQKLLSEAILLEANAFTFQHQGTDILVQLLQGEQKLKSFTIKATWYDMIHNWLALRVSPVLSVPKKANEPRHREHSACVGLRCGAEVVIAKVLKDADFLGERSIACVQLVKRSFSWSLEQYSLALNSRDSFVDLVQSTKGVLIVSSPTVEQLKVSVSSILALTQGHFAGRLQDSSTSELIKRYAERALLVVALQSNDPIEALSKCHELGYSFQEVPCVGVIGSAFVRSSCSNCLKETVIAPSVRLNLPEVLRPPAQRCCLLGKGCAACDHTGYRGLTALQSVLKLSPKSRELLAANGPAALLEEFYNEGLRPLLFDGVQKALTGLTTFEALTDLLGTLPPVYQRFLQREGLGEREDHCAIRADFFTSEGAAISGALETRSISDGIEEDGDSPLFSRSLSGKLRSTPLLLIVEDDPDQRAILEMVFKASNYEVGLAANGFEALKYLKQDVPDLIISDLMMPEMDGAELVSRLKSHDIYKKIPVLILTVVSDGDREYSLLDLGVDDYCEKSIQRKILLKRVENLVRRYQLGHGK